MTQRRRGRFDLLFALLAALLVLHPLLLELGFGRWFRLAFAAMMVGTCATVGRRRRTTWLAVGLALPAAIAQAAAFGAPTIAVSRAAAGLTLALLALVLVVVLEAVLARGTPTVDRIWGAVCVYLLLGLAWAMVHGLVWLGDADAYRVAGAGGGIASEADLFYFSFVTLTTLGFGDVVPVSPLARTSTWMEAVAGQLFLAVALARLVGLYVAEERPD